MILGSESTIDERAPTLSPNDIEFQKNSTLIQMQISHFPKYYKNINFFNFPTSRNQTTLPYNVKNHCRRSKSRISIPYKNSTTTISTFK